MLHGYFIQWGLRCLSATAHSVDHFRTGETADHAFEVHVGTAGKTPDQQKDGREETIDTHHLSNPIFVQESTGESLERRARWLATGCRNGLEGALAESPGGELESRL